MPTLTFCCGAECGIVGANAAPTVARRHWPNVGTTAPTINTALARSPGSRCYSFSPANTTSYLGQNITGSPTICVGRFAVRFETLPAGNAHLFSFNTGGSWCFVAFRASDNTLGVTISTTLATFTAGPVIVAGKWYVVDVKADVSANPWRIDFRVNGTAYTQYTTAIAANTFISFRVGGDVVNADKTHTVYIDDIAVSSTSGDYPLGSGAVIGLSPNVDGTHNFSASTDFEYNDTTGISPSATDVYTYIDDLPNNITDWISCNAASNTEYIEFGFADLPSSVASVNGVEVVAAMHASGTGANKNTMRLNDGGTLNDAWADSDCSNTTLTTVSEHKAVAPSSGVAWTAAKVNALLMRWNSSYGTIDVNAVPYLDAVMLEVDCNAAQTETSGTGTVTVSGVDASGTATGAATRTPDVGVVTVSGVDVAAFGASPQTATAGVADVAVSGVSPGASGTGSTTVVPDVASVSVSGVDASGTATGAATVVPGVGVVTVSGVDASAAGVGTATASSGVGTATVSGVDVSGTATGGVTTVPGVAAVSVSGVDASASATGAVTVVPDIAAVAVSGVSPGASGTGSVTIGTGVAQITVSGVDADASSALVATPGIATVTVSATDPAAAGVGVATAATAVASISVSAVDVAASGPVVNVRGGFGWIAEIPARTAKARIRVAYRLSARVAIDVSEKPKPKPIVPVPLRLAMGSCRIKYKIGADFEAVNHPLRQVVISARFTRPAIGVRSEVLQVTLATRILRDDLMLLGMH